MYCIWRDLLKAYSDLDARISKEVCVQIGLLFFPYSYNSHYNRQAALPYVTVQDTFLSAENIWDQLLFFYVSCV